MTTINCIQAPAVTETHNRVAQGSWRVLKRGAYVSGVLFISAVFLPVILSAWFCKAITNEEEVAESLLADDSGRWQPPQVGAL